jgi:hypothetical protein
VVDWKVYVRVQKAEERRIAMGWERAFTGAGKLGPFGGGHKTSRILSLPPVRLRSESSVLLPPTRYLADVAPLRRSQEQSNLP